MARRILIQMSGAPGSGKSTTARSLRSSLAAVVINHDVLRSFLVDSSMAFNDAAKHAYQLQWRLAKDFVEQGLNVIIDSPCNFEEILDQGRAMAKDIERTTHKNGLHMKIGVNIIRGRREKQIEHGECDE